METRHNETDAELRAGRFEHTDNFENHLFADAIARNDSASILFTPSSSNWLIYGPFFLRANFCSDGAPLPLTIGDNTISPLPPS
jgi:hypothetical protein